MIYKSRNFDFLLHLDADEGLFKISNYLRKNMTDAERILWDELKNRKLMKLKFRRQHPLHFYIADFYCHEKKLVIEVDGGIHNKRKQKIHDDNRSAELERYGIKVFRVKNKDIIKNIEAVKCEIIEFIKNLD
jgi:very-short-patch-repair endonuclease